MSWSPWPSEERPTASSITDDGLDRLLNRLERTERIVELITARPPWQRQEEANTSELFVLVRDWMHDRKHRQRSPLMAGRPAKSCRLCIMWARQIAYRWEDFLGGGDERVEKRLQEISELIERTHPTMAHPEEQDLRQARRYLPWLVSQVRRLQRDVRREEGHVNRLENDGRRDEQSRQDQRAENARLRKELAKLMADKI